MGESVWIPEYKRGTIWVPDFSWAVANKKTLEDVNQTHWGGSARIVEYRRVEPAPGDSGAGEKE